MASYDNEKAIIDDASSDNADGTKKIQPAFTSVDENRCVAPWCDLADRDSDALSYDELPKSLIAKIDIRLIPALAFSAQTLLAALADPWSVRHVAH